MEQISALNKANILSEALPYIQKFHGKIVVVKYGGNAMTGEDVKKSVINDIILMHLVGMKPIIVHGGGPEINSLLEQLNISSSFINGQRVTDKAIMKVVEMVLIGKVNTEIVSNINHSGGNAVGISGVDSNFLLCQPHNDQLGFVGEVEEVNVEFMESILKDGLLPVVSPIGIDREGNRYNINADYAAGKIAESMRAEKLLLLTDVEGIYANHEQKTDILSRVKAQDIPDLIAGDVIGGGMIPKVNCCVSALEKGVKSTHILDGRKHHSILLEIFTKEGIGTMVTK
ncbi:MAG: acetylglutamate kinase [Bacillota bacterium]|jgi:acetylglutamate kinase